MIRRTYFHLFLQAWFLCVQPGGALCQQVLLPPSLHGGGKGEEAVRQQLWELWELCIETEKEARNVLKVSSVGLVWIIELLWLLANEHLHFCMYNQDRVITKYNQV